MKNTFGQSITVTLFGESHGPAIGVVIDGLAPGVTVDEANIASELSKRRPQSELETARREEDRFEIVSGVFQGKTTGTPLCILIPNEDVNSRSYEYGKARPSHADYSAFMKYHGYEDYRGGGHFSGRITAALTAAGGILKPMLSEKGIRIGTHILKCGKIQDAAFSLNPESELMRLNNAAFPVLDPETAEKIRAEISEAKEEQDSIGGVTETVITGLPAGLGEPWFDSVESMLSHMAFSIGGIKGIEFGAGFELAEMSGSTANDAFRIKDGQVQTETNHSGGVNGGITNGMPVLFRCVVRPTPSIGKTQKTVDFVSMEETEITVNGRHDPAIIRRICPVIDSAAAIVVADLLAQRFGTDYFCPGGNTWSTD